MPPILPSHDVTLQTSLPWCSRQSTLHVVGVRLKIKQNPVIVQNVKTEITTFRAGRRNSREVKIYDL